MDEDINRRKYDRIIFQPERRPTLKIRTRSLEVKDLSQEGLRFVNQKKMPFKGWINGTLIFIDGEQLDIDGVVVRETNNELGIHLLTPIPSTRLQKEMQFILN